MQSIDEKTSAQAEMFTNRLKKRLSHLRKWAKRMNIEAFRLYDRDIPEIPLVLDKYDDIVSGALYRRPYEKNEAEEEKWLECMRDAAAQSLEINRDNIILKQRKRMRGQSQYEKQANRQLIREIREGAYTFKVNLSDYLDTGLFLDRRFLRRMIGDSSAGKHVLNLFCYTGTFSVYSGGAVSTASVDLSNTYLNWARENFALNGFGAELRRADEYLAGLNRARHTLIRSDAQTFVQKAREAGRRWDLIILDPPAFSNSKMAGADFDLKRDYEHLLAQCLDLLSPTGGLWFSVSAFSVKINAAELETSMAKHSHRVKVADYSNKITDEDFKGRKTPKTFLINVIP